MSFDKKGYWLDAIGRRREKSGESPALGRGRNDDCYTCRLTLNRLLLSRDPAESKVGSCLAGCRPEADSLPPHTAGRCISPTTRLERSTIMAKLSFPLDCFHQLALGTHELYVYYGRGVADSKLKMTGGERGHLPEHQHRDQSRRNGRRIVGNPSSAIIPSRHANALSPTM